MDWETHPHKPFYVDGSPNPFFILKATLGVLSSDMVLSSLPTVLKNDKIPLKRALISDFITKLEGF